jgi:hypothetical protein
MAVAVAVDRADLGVVLELSVKETSGVRDQGDFTPLVEVLVVRAARPPELARALTRLCCLYSVDLATMAAAAVLLMWRVRQVLVGEQLELPAERQTRAAVAGHLAALAAVRGLVALV